MEGIADGSPYLWDLIVASPAALARIAAGRSRRAHCRAACGYRRTPSVQTEDDADAMRDAAADEGRGVAADRGRRHRRRLGSEQGHARADRRRRCRGRRCGPLSCCAVLGASANCAIKNAAQPEHGSGFVVLALGKMGAFELNYSSDIDLMVFYDPAARRLAPRTEPGPHYRAHHARAPQAAAGTHRRRLCVPRRSAAAARSGLDPDRDLDSGGARLLRAQRPELGTRRVDQGAAMRRRHRRRRGHC